MNNFTTRCEYKHTQSLINYLLQKDYYWPDCFRKDEERFDQFKRSDTKKAGGVHVYIENGIVGGWDYITSNNRKDYEIIDLNNLTIEGKLRKILCIE